MIKRTFHLSFDLYKKHQVVRFLFAGGINTIFGYSLFAFLIFIKLHYSLAVLISSIVGVLFNFKATGKLVFRNSDNRLIFKFIIAYVAVYFVNIFCIKLLFSMGLNYYICGAVLILPMAALTYILQRKFVFHKKIIV